LVAMVIGDIIVELIMEIIQQIFCMNILLQSYISFEQPLAVIV